ncbi:sigma-70 family RNA polymerase sigma factor [Sutcliffiella halmapala]|uniref:sigma-70 family RNA polymerase sigma factor n=1 Tax=Sutcliffiella halmapala TaxID=79882 RepID=UPI00099514C4|nr:sigma-70 family RNA polymerase sigma factor [Sutcliffiella halmapala]
MERGESTIEEKLLIRKTVAGDEQAFRMLINQYRIHIYHTVYAILRNEKDAEDAAQEVFIKVFYALPAFQAKGLKTWMTRIAVNHAIDLKRKTVRRAEDISEEFEVTSTETVDRLLLHKEFQHYVKKRIDELPDNYLTVVQSFYIEDKTYKQIAVEQNIEEKTVEMKLYRARLWMKKNWREEEFQ